VYYEGIPRNAPSSSLNWTATSTMASFFFFFFNICVNHGLGRGRNVETRQEETQHKLNLTWWQTFRQTTFSSIFQVVYINPQNSFCGLPKIQFMRRQSRVPAEKNWFLFFIVFCFVEILFGFSGRECCLPRCPIWLQVLGSHLRRARRAQKCRYQKRATDTAHFENVILIFVLL